MGKKLLSERMKNKNIKNINKNNNTRQNGAARYGGSIIQETAAGDALTSETAPVFSHLPVMLHSAVDGLAIKPDGVYVDCTAGGGGHSEAIAERLSGGGVLISIDRDADAIDACRKRLSRFGDTVKIVHDNYANLPAILDDLGIKEIDGILMDLGVSSYQIDTTERGFSYSADEDAPLDMRMDRRSPLDAKIVVNSYSEDELCRIIRDYGEERFAARIAKRIVEERQREPILTTRRLSEIIKSAVPAASVQHGSHPAKRTFQAIRIEVNGELDAIEPTLRFAISVMRSGGRASVITFHSLEDRIVKTLFTELSVGCTCPPDFPVCVCGRRPSVKIINKKPITADEEELKMNPRSRSAKLRVAEKI